MRASGRLLTLAIAVPLALAAGNVFATAAGADDRHPQDLRTVAGDAGESRVAHLKTADRDRLRVAAIHSDEGGDASEPRGNPRSSSPEQPAPAVTVVARPTPAPAPRPAARARVARASLAGSRARTAPKPPQTPSPQPPSASPPPPPVVATPVTPTAPSPQLLAQIALGWIPLAVVLFLLPCAGVAVWASSRRRR